MKKLKLNNHLNLMMMDSVILMQVGILSLLITKTSSQFKPTILVLMLKRRRLSNQNLLISQSQSKMMMIHSVQSLLPKKIKNKLPKIRMQVKIQVLDKNQVINKHSHKSKYQMFRICLVCITNSPSQLLLCNSKNRK